MLVDIPQAVLQTEIFVILFLLILLITSRKKASHFSFNLKVTNEIKGFAIIFIIFAHIGYYLSKDTNFLFPVSVLAGVGVNLFLFLSGYGLTLSQINRPLTIKQFFRKRLERLYIPLWIILAIFLVADHSLLNINYPPFLTIQNFIGLFPQADLYTQIDSPLWYFTLILFYYLVFPLTKINKTKYLAPIIVLTLTYLIVNLNIPYIYSTNELYKVHSVSFPLGMFLALTAANFSNIYKTAAKILNKYFIIYAGILISLIIFVCYTSINSGVGQGNVVEQFISVCMVIAIVLIFILKKNEFKLFTLFGKFSYEIYLFHWPLLYRYDLLYKILPGVLATLLYLPLFLGIGEILQYLTDRTWRIIKIK